MFHKTKFEFSFKKRTEKEVKNNPLFHQNTLKQISTTPRRILYSYDVKQDVNKKRKTNLKSINS